MTARRPGARPRDALTPGARRPAASRPGCGSDPVRDAPWPRPVPRRVERAPPAIGGGAGAAGAALVPPHHAADARRAEPRAERVGLAPRVPPDLGEVARPRHAGKPLMGVVDALARQRRAGALGQGARPALGRLAARLPATTTAQGRSAGRSVGTPPRDRTMARQAAPNGPSGSSRRSGEGGVPPRAPARQASARCPVIAST